MDRHEGNIGSGPERLGDLYPPVDALAALGSGGTRGSFGRSLKCTLVLVELAWLSRRLTSWRERA